ncbi:MAG TPA: single-stranded-DNA-specific exonuclease RecJ, partial [Gemmatimonadales bacterium]|nr:single-stranded-DNA-specific exonuclease RecJ [Gemmatimonadales bacterium]
YALAGMREAVAAIRDAIARGVPILVHGDYDVDGQCSTAILTRALQVAGAQVVPFIPHRIRDGYDFGLAGLEAARAAGAGLVLTCDCGITAVEPVRLAREAGMAVVVTDHHLLGTEVPGATAIVNPQRPDDTSGLRQLCGAGIAFMLVRALVPALGLPANLPFHFLDLAALATVADVVPLKGDNRIIVRHGLRLLPESRWAGVRALIAQASLEGKEIRAGQVGFILGPRLNAAGRIGEPMDGLRLLLTDAPAEGRALAARLEVLNGERQALDQKMLDEALAQAEAQGGTAASGFVLEHDDWHPGVVGIVASRVVERYGRPTFLVALDGETGRGSGRSISRFDLHGALHACGDLLERFGGHRMAAGLTVRRALLPEFRRRFNELVALEVPPDELGPEQRIDIVIDLADATAELERYARHLEPCGMGNPSPVLGVRGVRVANRRRVGSNHLKGVLQQGGAQLPIIGFGWWDRVPWLADAPVDVAFRLESDAWNGNVQLQARLCAMCPAGSAG